MNEPSAKAWQQGMRKAVRLTGAGRLMDATRLLQAALSGIGAAPPAMPGSKVIDGVAFALPEQETASVETPPRGAARLTPNGAEIGAKFGAEPRTRPRTGHGAASGGQFLRGGYTGEAGGREYRLYVPAGYHGAPVPLIVMLHGCTQSPEDFAAGTGMNDAAEAQTCLVAYPAQPASANPQKCWNWFRARDQQRGAGEPAILAGLTRQIMAEYAVDPARIYVAGLSAGGAAAAIMGHAYPDLFAAIGVHSGLACGAARNVASAMAAMKNGAPGVARISARTVPTIVFHGQQDSTVHPRNGEAVAASAAAGAAISVQEMHGASPGGRRYRRILQQDASGKTVVELWFIEAAGHAWAGGRDQGTYTDPRGPDATAEMLRFFLSHPAADRHGEPP